MQIDHITFSKTGGAGVVASLLSSSQKALGHDPRLLTVLDGSLSEFPFKYPSLTIRAALDNFFIARADVPSLTSLSRRGLGELDSEIVRKNSAVHFHWVEGVITPDNLRYISQHSLAAVWTLHDMAPFTGFCHLSHGCRGFETDCTKCPQSRRPFHRSIALSLKKRASTFAPISEKLKIVVPSEWMREKASKSLVFKNFDIQVIRNPVSPVFYSKPKNEYLRKELGIEDKEFVAILVATDLDDPNKRVQKAIEVFLSTFEHRAQRVRLVLIGRSRRDRFHRDPRLDFRGPLGQEAVSDLLSAADVVLSTSMAESSGLTIAEAAAAGTPALVLEGDSGSKELVVDGVTGILTENWRGFGESLVWLASDARRAPELGVSANKFARHHFETESVSQKYLDLYAKNVSDT